MMVIVCFAYFSFCNLNWVYIVIISLKKIVRACGMKFNTHFVFFFLHLIKASYILSLIKRLPLFFVLPDLSHCRIYNIYLYQHYCRLFGCTETSDRCETDLDFDWYWDSSSRLVNAFVSWARAHARVCHICETCLLHSLILLAVQMNHNANFIVRFAVME